MWQKGMAGAACYHRSSVFLIARWLVLCNIYFPTDSLHLSSNYCELNKFLTLYHINIHTCTHIRMIGMGGNVVHSGSFIAI